MADIETTPAAAEDFPDPPPGYEPPPPEIGDPDVPAPGAPGGGG